MNARASGHVVQWLAALVFLLVCLGAGAAHDNAACLECHAREGLRSDQGGRIGDVTVDAERFGKSVHGELDCVDCHTDLIGMEETRHAADPMRVDCTTCHEDDDGPLSSFWNSTHGQQVRAAKKDAPLCQDCHGDHYVLPLSDPESSISPFNIPRMCAQCHAEGAAVERTHDIPEKEVFNRYRDSIHGEALYKQGLIVTAVCTSCHTGHSVKPHDDPSSTIHKDNIAATCEQCHGRIEEVHNKVISGQQWEREGAVPICVDCHSPHEIRKVFYDTNMSNAECLRCHGEIDIVSSADQRSLYVDKDVQERSIHGRNGVSCAQCHAGATPTEWERSCSTIEAKVDCSVCHEKHVIDYRRGRHAQLHYEGDSIAPYCTDCHGRHDIEDHEMSPGMGGELAAQILDSPTFSRNVPELCARCHRDGAPAAERAHGDSAHVVERYFTSVHGTGLMESGLTVTATCSDCHSPHKGLPKSDPESTVNEQNIVATCGKCHEGISEQYQTGIHSAAGDLDHADRRRRGLPDLPQCNDCHSAHTVNRTDIPAFQLGIMGQCAKCHEDDSSSYFATYHGKASALGDAARAKCQDCHGAHDIREPADPASPLSRDNIVATCAACHPRAHRQFAAYLIYATPHDPNRYPWLFSAFWGMALLLISTFGIFEMHTQTLLPRRSMMPADEGSRAMSGVPGSRHHSSWLPSILRMLRPALFFSFFGLAITGMVVKFSHTGWARLLAQVMGGVDRAGLMHRACAVITFGCIGIHLWDVWRRWRQSDKALNEFAFGPETILPKRADARELLGTLKWVFGTGPRPSSGRWTLWEKFEYFSVFWGVATIGTTGLFLCFPEFFTRYIPGWWLNVAVTVHGEEALLATVFIFTIHFFNTNIRSRKTPTHPATFSSRVQLVGVDNNAPSTAGELEARGENQQVPADQPSRAFVKVAKLFRITTSAVAFTLVGLIVYALLFAGR